MYLLLAVVIAMGFAVVVVGRSTSPYAVDAQAIYTVSTNI
jgi:hypothetical protein